MIAISYYYDTNDVFKTQIFDTDEEAKLWFIDELFNNSILHYWFDGKIEDNDDNCVEYYKEYDIRNCLLKIDLTDIIKKLKYLVRIQVNIVKKD